MNVKPEFLLGVLELMALEEVNQGRREPLGTVVESKLYSDQHLATYPGTRPQTSTATNAFDVLLQSGSKN